MTAADFKRTLNAFAKHGNSMATLSPVLAQLRLGLQLRLTQRNQRRPEFESGADIDDQDLAAFEASAMSSTVDDFAADTECIFQLQELLYSDSGPPNSSSVSGLCLSGKLHLLLLLQENANALIRSQKGLVQLLSFLLELTKSQQQQQPIHLTAQAMVCCCSLIIAGDLLRDEDQLCSKFISHLLELVGSVNSIHGILLRFRALQCLIALEDFYPCILSKKLDYFYQFCTSERTYLSEFYYILFSMLLVHVFNSCMKESGSWSDDRLCSRVESLPALSLSSMQPLRGRQSLLPTAASAIAIEVSLSTSSSSPELSRAVGHLTSALDSGRLSPVAFSALCRCVGHLLDAIGAGGRGLRTAFYRRLPSWDAIVLAALAGLRQRFGLAALGCSDELGGDWLALSIQRVASSPLFSTPLRLLMCHYLSAYPHLRLCRGRDTFPEPASRQLVAALLPGIFDPVDLRVLKVRLLSLRFAPKDSSDEASACLMGTLVSLSRPAIKSGGSGRHAVAFFASLYAVFSRHHASVLGDDIRQMLISMVNANLAFADHLLDFLDCVTQDFPDSELPYQAYSELCDFVAVNSLENASDKRSLSRYMTILNRAAMYNRISPQPIVDFLVQLVAADEANLIDDADLDAADAVSDAGNWLCGHLVLDVCRSIFRTHWSKLHSDPEMMAALCGVVANWAGLKDDSLDIDVDVRSRAQLYYSLACHMSAKKLASIVFESATAIMASSPVEASDSQSTDRSINTNRTRTSLAVTAPPATQAMPEMRVLTKAPIELLLKTDSIMVEFDQAQQQHGDSAVLLVPVQLICHRTPELVGETCLLAGDLTFSAYSDYDAPCSVESNQKGPSNSEDPIATVEPIHLPRIRLPKIVADNQSTSPSSSQIDLKLRVFCHRPLPFGLEIRLDCTAGVECRPLTSTLSPLRLSLSDLLQPLPSNRLGVDLSNWCQLDRPGASFVRFSPGRAATIDCKLARYRLPANGEASSTTNCCCYGFRVSPNCQLRLQVTAAPLADLLYFCVIEDDCENAAKLKSPSGDAWQLLLHFDRYLKANFE